MRLPVVAVAATILLIPATVACSDNPPALCGSVDDLSSQVDSLSDIDFTSTTPSDVQSAMTNIKNNLDTVKTDAKSEFATEVKPVESAFTTLQSSFDKASKNPTAGSVADAGTALSDFSTAVKTFTKEVKSTC
jgi:hypothetical protein